MNGRLLLIFAACLICGLAAFVISTRGGPVSKPASQGEAKESAPVSEAAAMAERAAFETETRIQTEQLASLEAKKRRRDIAAAKTHQVRSELQLAKFSLWLEVISTNQHAYQVLRHTMNQSPNGEVRCTICDGTGWRSFCILCQDGGNCPTCRGSGKETPDGICPTCLGNGKCYLCAGGKRMACQFCLVGTISSKVPPPPSRLPLFCDAPPPPETIVADAQDAQVRAGEHTEKPAFAPPPSASRIAAVHAVVLGAAAFLTLGIVGILFKRRFDSLIAAGNLAEDRAKHLLAEDPSLAAFFSELRHGLHPGAPAAVAGGPLNAVPPQPQEVELAGPTDPLGEFFAAVPDQLASLRQLFSDFSRAADEAGRQTIILEFLRQVSALKDLARPVQLRPVWLMTCALEGLLKQLSRDTAEVTASVLRTVAGAVDLLETLCVRGLNPNLATEPPVRLLAVDDDPISRLAISFALKKAFDAPDLAPNGAAALTLTTQEAYDVIFLDVEMPGMDGYELCTKIRQTAQHRTTPVVFVTRHGDFNSRAKSTLSGGESLIAKPFLAFEITVKALTLALRGRLQNRAVESQSANKAAVPLTTIATSAAPAEETSAARMGRENQSAPAPSSIPDEFNFSARMEATEAGSPEALFTHAPAFLVQLRAQLLAAQYATQRADLQTFLGRLCVGIHSFNLESERAELRAVARLASALEGLVKKLLERPQLCSPSALHAADAALELLEDLCSQAATHLDLTRSNVRILVVDDDPIARRAISGSIQLVFGRPDHAEHGKAALALAAEQPFDLIFLDVLMPGMDGFSTCRKIRETALNRQTPVVFITSHDDAQARARAQAAGGGGFISKPVLASQITLTALTYILRARLNQQPSPALEATEEAACLMET